MAKVVCVLYDDRPTVTRQTMRGTGLRSSTAIPAARHTSHAGAHSYSAGDATSGSEEAARFKAKA
ncbi:hypothetical protein [Mesorhizobium sp.]|uniref:hypothetical protein n=1 Tax=Mesorhizobium sp. TaxID=1871066 RepID=UPI00257CF385|nr:hypothetical protein [Mesorhizobium sp.]